jgi:hypothetical protein
MGADIHGVLQSRFKNDRGEWSSWWSEEEIYDTRHYLMFSYLADVRNYHGVRPISEPRGLPEDFKVGGIDYDNGEHNLDGRRIWMGDHSPSWLLLSEIRDHDYPEEDREYLDTFFKWVDYAASKCGGYENGRIVFGFDS